MSPKQSPLAPIDPKSVEEGQHNENEKSASWIKRGIAGSITGRVLRSTYETLRASGTNVVCLSPWGDSSPLLLPCIRFRDLAIQAVMVSTGGTAAIASPVTDSMSDAAAGSLTDSVLVELVNKAVTDVTDNIFIETPIESIADRIKQKDLRTTHIKVFSITLKHKNTQSDASLGFYRSSVHKDRDMFSSVKDYLSVEKGWFSPYLFASSRRPVIPRTMQPDVVFCHGPFLSGDYRIGQVLLSESHIRISFCETPAPPPEAPATEHSEEGGVGSNEPKESHGKMSKFTNIVKGKHSDSSTLKNLYSPHESSSLAPGPRRMVITLVGIKPHRKTVWTSSARPGESIIRYALMDGCPSILVPVQTGSPLLAYNTLTLSQIWKLSVPSSDTSDPASPFQQAVDVLFEYVNMCIDWDRVTVSKDGKARHVKEKEGQTDVKEALRYLLAAAVYTKESAEVKKEVDEDRAGIAMWRIP